MDSMAECYCGSALCTLAGSPVCFAADKSAVSPAAGSRNVNAKSGDLVFAEKCITFALHRSSLVEKARLLRCMFMP